MRVAVAMSGGVDSLRSAALLKEWGYDVFAIHMRLLPASRDGRRSAATAVKSSEDRLRTLTAKLGIPLVVVDLRDAFHRSVISPFLQAYRQGLTPNPCVVCNPRIKFGLLLDEVRRLKAERLATGHYARIIPPDHGSNRFRLCRARHVAKDQSYFLHGLTQAQLSAVLFPLGNLSKQEVLGWAEESGFSALLLRESQDICFIPSGSTAEFLQENLERSPLQGRGVIVDLEGKVLGEHKGIFAYTIGQRRGLGIASTAPYYVVGLDAVTNTVRVGRADDLLCSCLQVDELNWVSLPPPSEPLHASVRIRNQHRPAPAWITPLSESRAHVRFDTPQRAVTPGQAAVFYENDLLLGGGTICPPTGKPPL